CAESASFLSMIRVARRSQWPIAMVLLAVLSGAAPLSAMEDAAARARLPEFETIPAARPDELTPASGAPAAEALRTWTVSHGDAGARRYSALTQIDRLTVRQL